MVGMPASLWLNEFGALVYHAFGEYPYHVGSSLRAKDGWRDVDVRLMLADEVYGSMGLGDPARPHDNARWVAFCVAFSALGKQMTGLPIDFQIQTITEANEKFGRGAGCERSALGFGYPKIETMPSPLETGRAVDQLIEKDKLQRALESFKGELFRKQHDDGMHSPRPQEGCALCRQE
jgi:hypothetical protein